MRVDDGGCARQHTKGFVRTLMMQVSPWLIFRVFTFYRPHVNLPPSLNKSALPCSIDNPAGQRIYDLWAEYEAGESAEAKAVKEMGAIETATQSLEHQQSENIDLSEYQQVCLTY